MQSGASITVDTAGGVGPLVLDGSFTESEDALEHLSWLRVPVNGRFTVEVGANGAKVWIKTGHLRFVEQEKQQLA